MMDQDKIAKTSDKVRTLLIYEKIHDYICLKCLKISFIPKEYSEILKMEHDRIILLHVLVSGYIFSFPLSHLAAAAAAFRNLRNALPVPIPSA